MSNIIPNAQSFTSGQGTVHLVIVHGLGGTPDDYRRFATEINSFGIKVHCPRLTGHGIDLNSFRAAKVNDWIEDIDQVFKKIPIDEPIILMGASFGGDLVLYYAAHHPKVSAIVLLNPAFNYRVGGIFQNIGLHILQLFTPYYRKPGLTIEDKRRYAMTGSMTAWPIKIIIDTKNFISQQVKSSLPLIHQPVLLIYNPDDPYIGNSQSNNFYKLLGSNVKIEFVLPGHTHRPIRDENLRPLISKATANFILNQLPKTVHHARITTQKN